MPDAIVDGTGSGYFWKIDNVNAGQVRLLNGDTAVAVNNPLSTRTVIYDELGFPVGTDKITESMKLIDYEHHEIHDGNHFFICNFDIGVNSGGLVTFGIITPNTTTWSHMTFEVEGTTQTEFRVYEGTTLSGGVANIPFNNNRNSVTASVLSVRKNPAVSGTTPLSGTIIFAQSKGLEGTTPSRGSNQGIVSREREIILKSGTSYLFEIKSVGAGNIISYCGEWYEHVNKH